MYINLSFMQSPCRVKFRKLKKLFVKIRLDVDGDDLLPETNDTVHEEGSKTRLVSTGRVTIRILLPDNDPLDRIQHRKKLNNENVTCCSSSWFSCSNTSSMGSCACNITLRDLLFTVSNHGSQSLIKLPKFNVCNFGTFISDTGSLITSVKL